MTLQHTVAWMFSVQPQYLYADTLWWHHSWYCEKPHTKKCNSKRSQEPSCIMISKSFWSVDSLHITHSNSQQPLWNQIPWNSRGVPLCADPKLFGEGLSFSGIVAHSCTMKWLRCFRQWLHTKWFRNSRAHCEMKSLPMNRVSLAHKRE